MAVSSVVMMGAGMASSAIGASTAASGQKSQLQYQAAMGSINAAMAESDASILELNASITDAQADQAIAQGQREQQKLRLGAAQLKGRQRASLAANGVDLGVGSAARVLATTDYMTEVDAGEIRANAARAAFGYKVQGVNQKFAAMSARVQGANYKAGSAFASATASGISPLASGVGSLLGSAGSVAPSVYKTGQGAGWWS
jgi:hypothetical protein